MTHEDAIQFFTEALNDHERGRDGDIYTGYPETIEAFRLAVDALTKISRYETQWLTKEGMKDPLEPLKVSSALNSEIFKLQYRLENSPESVSILDYTIIAVLKKYLDEVDNE